MMFDEVGWRQCRFVGVWILSINHVTDVTDRSNPLARLFHMHF